MSADRTIVYCIIPPELADELHQVLRDHFRAEPDVEVIVEQRAAERRRSGDRRAEAARLAEEEERRRLRARRGRRIADRRARSDRAAALQLPAEAAPHEDNIRFITRREPSTLESEDVDTARMITRLQAGERPLFSDLYMRYFDRVYAYLRIILQDDYEAEDAAQEVFIKTLEALPTYERREAPFRAWLFRIVRNSAVNRLRQRKRLRFEPPEELAVRTDAGGRDTELDWLDDRDLVTLVEQLPLAQRQVVVLRYMMDLRSTEIAQVLHRSPDAIRQLHQRAMRFLRERLDAPSSGSPRTEGTGAVRRESMLRLRRPSPVLRSRRYLAA